MKERKGGNQRMIDFIQTRPGGLQAHKSKELSNVKPEVQNSEEEFKHAFEQIMNYNQNIHNIPQKYKDLKMLNHILVKCFKVVPTISENGTLLPQTSVVNIPTVNGVQSHTEINNIGYDFKAVIVSSPSNYSLVKAGDVVILEPGVVVPRVVGNTKDGYMQVIDAQFLYPDGKGAQRYQPVFGDEDYGYIRINFTNIVAKIKLSDVE